MFICKCIFHTVCAYVSVYTAWLSLWARRLRLTCGWARQVRTWAQKSLRCFGSKCQKKSRSIDTGQENSHCCTSLTYFDSLSWICVCSSQPRRWGVAEVSSLSYTWHPHTTLFRSHRLSERKMAALRSVYKVLLRSSLTQARRQLSATAGDGHGALGNYSNLLKVPGCLSGNWSRVGTLTLLG